MSNIQNKAITAESLINTRKGFLAKLRLNICLILLGGFLVGVFLFLMQANAAVSKQKKNNDRALDEVMSILEKNERSADLLTSIFHEGNVLALENIKDLFEGGFFDSVYPQNDSVRTEMFGGLAEASGTPYLFLLSGDGRIVISREEGMTGLNPAATSHMTQENLNRILSCSKEADGNIVPIRVRNQHGEFFFYSIPFNYRGTSYVLAIGEDAAALDDQIDSLRNISAVVSRISVRNDGFIFAVDKRDGLFIYFKENDNLLSGQNALRTGLSEKALKDGYSGVETIQGVRYYCTSREMDENTVIATARIRRLFGRDRTSIIWTVAGFIIVMTLCLAYAIIVRNDYIRKDIRTDAVVLGKGSDNPRYFDKTIFGKVRPLMLIGVMAVFGITFYAQTLLEISEGVELSDVVLQSVTGRYEESTDARTIVQNYYSSRFLNSARLISFMVEETPDILNEESDRFHRTYDNEGNRQYVLDDEGNRLKSVPSSALLQNICDRNHIKSVYVFDEDGHVIATNTDNWFFVLSNDVNDQSYPFRRILEGKTDSYLQSSMTSDVGQQSQFFGVLMHYYTTVDSRGNTVYVSRSDYEDALALTGTQDGRMARGITKHSSLLQIELDHDLVDQIMEPTSAEYLLSTKMLGNGGIVLFDSTDEHRCAYSPVSTSVGKAAADLGVSPNAFSDISTEDYYGFSTLNGVSYFSFFRYVNGYYFATLIPKANMYRSRAIIALCTAAVSLVLVQILLLTVTVTTREEEELFRRVNAVQEERTWNSKIFDIILPSGRQASTMEARSRWDNRHIPWRERSPELKLALLLQWITVFIILYIMIYLAATRNSLDDHSIIRYILSGMWDKGPNIFAFSACGLVIGTAIIVVKILGIPVNLSTAILGTRGETVGHLLLSVLKYGGAIGVVFYCLYLVGIDSKSLLASAGILSLVVGFGAQSLIKDIIAGIFIVFEGEFRVGDIVTIGGFRGTVVDIGLRTTKILANGNIKIFNNSDISGVLNMTKETSVASIDIRLKYATDIHRLEKKLPRELARLKRKNSRIVEGPYYLGITAIEKDFFIVTIEARCSEEDIDDVTSFLNKELIFLLSDYFPDKKKADGEVKDKKELPRTPVVEEKEE